MARADVGRAVLAVDRAPLMRADRVNSREGALAGARQQKHSSDGIDEYGAANLGQRAGHGDLNTGVRKLALQNRKDGRRAAAR